MQSLTTSLMFVGPQHGRAEEAIELYVSLFDDSRVIAIERYGPGEGEPEGTVKQARFSLAGREFTAMDSAFAHEFSFTPAISITVACDRAQEVDELFATLSEEGSVLMPLQAYPFSKRFAWVQDRFGVSWQLNLVSAEPPAER